MTRHAKQTGIRIATIAICLTGAGLAEMEPASAHHSYSTTYDSNNTQTILPESFKVSDMLART